MPDISSIIQKYRGLRTAVYGLSTETEKILPELDRVLEVVGLLDGYREDGTLYGKPIISMGQAVQQQVKLILVAARPGSCRVIAKRIGEQCRAHGIVLLDVRGRNLCDLQEAVYDLNHVQGVTRAELLQKATAADAVSFDLFDTLVMRQVLFPSDVYELMDGRLRKEGTYIENFCGKRMESEKHLSQAAAPTLTKIYTYLLDACGFREISAEKLAEMEWEIDLELLNPRREMCEFFDEVCGLGKDVYIVTDTYYTKKQIVYLLDRCGIHGYREILASCEYGTGKKQELFGRLKEQLLGRSCIHIGDDLSADIESAQEYGLEACQISSGTDLLEKVGYLGLWDHLESLSDRIKAGMFTARLFNSPFQFEQTDRKLCVQNAQDIGYLFFAPMISDFVLWFDQQTREDRIPNLWFGARDGWLIRKMYEELTGDTSSVYFLTSRTAAIRAGVETEEDIAYVEEMKFSGSLEEQLKKRFGLRLEAGKKGEKLSDYGPEILAKAETDRANYKSYIDRLDIRPGAIAFFDFVAKGTSQLFLRRLVPNHLKGYYFLRLGAADMQEQKLDIRSFYDSDALEGSAIFDNYYILETMLTSAMPSVEGFDERGEALYAEETRKESDMRCFQKAQDGICQYFRTYLQISSSVDRQIDRKMDELFLMLIHKIEILDPDFRNLTVEDPFFNRMTEMEDLL